MRVSGDDVHLSAGFLEFCVVVGSVFNFSRAVKRESGWHKNHDRPFALHGLVGHVDELAIQEGSGFKRLELGIDQGHEVDFL